MRTLYATAFLLAAGFMQAQVTITTTEDDTFVPEMTSIDLGETVTFIVMDGHTATQVSEATWLANDDEPLPGGFDFDEGTHVYTPTTEGTIYYVCQPHADDGMKGQILVNSTVGINEENLMEAFRIYPNPATAEISVETSLESGTLVFVDVLGKEVMRAPITFDRKLDISELNEGNYTVILRGQEGNEVGKTRFIVAR